MQGWICPKCGHVYAPFVAECIHCPASLLSTTETTAVSPCLHWNTAQRTDGTYCLTCGARVGGCTP